MMSARECFVFGCEMSERVFKMLPRESLALSCKTVEHRSRKSRDFLQTDEFMVTHPCLVVTAFSVVRDHSSGRCVVWKPDSSLYFYRETGNSRFTGSEIRGTAYHW